MAGNNEPVHSWGNVQTPINTPADIANGNFSTTPTEVDFTTDSVVPNAPYALAILQAPDWGAAPTANSVVSLWVIEKDVDGTSDCTGAPSGTSQGGAKFVGNFVLYATDELQRRAIVIDIKGIKKADFYIKNESGQNMNNDGGTACTLKIIPFSFKPNA